MVEINIYWRRQYLCTVKAKTIEELKYRFDFKFYLESINRKFGLKLSGVIFEDITFRYKDVEEAKEKAIRYVEPYQGHVKRVNFFMNQLRGFKVVEMNVWKGKQFEPYQLNNDGYISTHGKVNYNSRSLCFRVEPKY